MRGPQSAGGARNVGRDPSPHQYLCQLGRIRTTITTDDQLIRKVVEVAELGMDMTKMVETRTLG